MQAKIELTKKPRESSFCLDLEPVDEEKELREENMKHCQAKYPCSTLLLLLQDSVKKHFGFIKRHPLIPVLWILIYGAMCGAIVWGITACIILSFIISALFYGVMIHKQVQTDEIREKSELLVQEAMETVRAQAELNDYIAHEIRGPLSAAMSACAFVSSSINETQPLEDKESQTALKEDVAIIDASLQFVNDLLRSILDLSRATNNRLTLQEVPVDILSDILQPVAAMLYQRDRNFQVLVECPENLVVITDRLRLKQVILNLGRNAVKFVEYGFVRLGANIVNGVVHIYIEDSGPGIPAQKRMQLFEKFQDSLDVLSQGTGIGLNLCHHLVGLMGGEIYLDESYVSNVENCPGARFVIKLNAPPMSVDNVGIDFENDQLDLDTAAPTERSMGSSSCISFIELPEKLSVLFVDDDMVQRKLFARSLRKVQPNWIVAEAANGETALSMVESHDFDLIFLDQYMSSTGKQLLGTETARALRAQGYQGIICGLSATDMETPFCTAGADAFVIKPFPFKEEPMRRELSRVLNREVANF